MTPMPPPAPPPLSFAAALEVEIAKRLAPVHWYYRLAIAGLVLVALALAYHHWESDVVDAARLRGIATQATREATTQRRAAESAQKAEQAARDTTARQRRVTDSILRVTPRVVIRRVPASPATVAPVDSALAARDPGPAVPLPAADTTQYVPAASFDALGASCRAERFDAASALAHCDSSGAHWKAAYWESDSARVADRKIYASAKRTSLLETVGVGAIVAVVMRLLR